MKSKGTAVRANKLLKKIYVIVINYNQRELQIIVTKIPRELSLILIKDRPKISIIQPVAKQ